MDTWRYTACAGGLDVLLPDLDITRARRYSRYLSCTFAILSASLPQ